MIKSILITHLFILSIICTATGQSDWLEYKEKNKYRVQYPADWEINTSGIMGTTFFIFSPVVSTEDQFRENVNFMIQDLGNTKMTLSDYTNLSIKQIQSIITDAQVVENKTEIKDGKEFQKVIYTGKQGVFALKFEQYYWIIKDKAYLLTFTCEEDQFDEYKATGERIMNSLTLLK